MNCVIAYISILELHHQARAAPSVIKELFEESAEETQERVMSIFMNNKI
jgi:hypothetical protein